METDITKEVLVKYGFTDNTVGKEPSDWHPDMMTKDLRSDEARKDNPDEVFCLAITCERNVQEFCLRLPHGCGTLYLGFESMAQLEAFEKSIGSHSPEW